MKNEYRLMGLILWAIAVPLAGCASTPKPGDTTTANLPIGVRCEAKPVPVPEFAVDQLPLTATEGEQFDALDLERIQRIAYEIELLAAVMECQ